MHLCVGSLSKRKKLHEFINSRCGNLSNLETFWNRSAVEAAIRDLPDIWIMCDSVDGDTVVLVKRDSQVQIRKIAELFSEGSRGLEVYAVNAASEPGWYKVDGVVRRKTKEARYVISTNRSPALQLTKGHSLFILEDNVQKLVRPIELQVGCKLLEGLLVDNFKGIEERLVNIKFDGKSQSNTVVFSNVFLEFVGLWLANGSYQGREGGVQLSAANDTECRKVIEGIAGEWGITVTYCKNGVDCTFSASTQLSRCMRALGINGYSNTKEVPWWAFELSEEGMCSLLRGYFSGDGSVSVENDRSHRDWRCGKVGVGGVSYRLVYGMWYLLQMVGIRAILKKFTGRLGGFSKGNTTWWEIRIYDGENIKLFQDKIGFCHVEKSKRLDQLVICKLRNVSKSRYDWHRNRNKELKVLKVEKIDGELRYVYDMQVRTVERFNGNGVVVHNSGAHSMYNKYVKPYGDRFVADFSWVKGKDFTMYMDSYIAWQKKFVDKVGICVGLDVIGSAQETWNVQQIMESNGLKPMPVFHFGDDISWLYKYIDKYEYIGIGGVATYANNMGFYDDIFRKVGKTKGKPNVKLHGFACTDFKSMERYPWFSVDSISWTLYAAYGFAMFPQYNKGKFTYGKPIVIKCSDVRSQSCGHNFIYEYVEMVGDDVIRAYLDEVGIEHKGQELQKIVGDNDNRCKMNLWYFAQLEKMFSAMTDWDVYKHVQRKFL